MTFENTIFNEDCITGMRSRLPDGSIDLIVTSPPYNVGIQYDAWDDRQSWSSYYDFMQRWISEAHRVLKPDGRIVVNIPYEVNMMERGGRVYLSSEYWQVMKDIGFKFAGVVDLEEDCPQRVKLTAWGSWLSPSAPYIYNPKECLIIACKDHWKKDNAGVPYFTEATKREFQDLVYGMWKYRAETNGLTQANFSYDIPINALKILTFEGDTVLDPFMGSGTTAEACIRMNRRYVGFEISKNYCEKMKCRTQQSRLVGGPA